jgi:two-component system, LytTR family, response regulator
MIRAIVVDDEPYCCDTLETMLEKYCPGVQLVAVCHSGEEAIAGIKQHQPDLVFLDIEMPRMNGFDMLQKIGAINFEIIFTTSFDQYALRAIRFSALDYLLKPIDKDDLQTAVQKVIQRTQKPITQQLQLLMQKLQQPTNPINKIALPTMEGLQMLPVESILYCESDSNYTIFHLKDKQKIIVSRTLKEMEEMLEEYSFARVHSSYLVNLQEVNKYIKGEGGYLVLNDGSSVNVSASRKKLLLSKLQPWKI